jgi:hypothetical protein
LILTGVSVYGLFCFQVENNQAAAQMGLRRTRLVRSAQGVHVETRTEWDAESFRVTFFVTADWKQRPLFAEIAGAPPAEAVSRPQLQVLQETGSAFGSSLSVAQQQERIDLILGSQPPQPQIQFAQMLTTPDNRFPRVGRLVESMAEFDKLSAKLAALVFSVVRVAFAVSLVVQTDSSASALLVLKQHIHSLDFDPKLDSDFVFQINRPRILEGAKINRLTRWEAIESRLFSVAQTAQIVPAASSHAARAYIDISTTAERAEVLSPEVVRVRLDQFSAFALEIAEKGDVR